MTSTQELRTKEGTDHEVVTTYQYVFDLRNLIEETSELARENLTSAQQKYKTHLDKKAKMRTTKVGDEVLMMLPTDHSKLLLHWKGPYTVIEKVGITDYRIEIGDSKKLFHVNMLREYTERYQSVAS